MKVISKYTKIILKRLELLMNQEPTVGVCLFDEREHYIGRYEVFFTGSLYSSGEVWRYYKVYNGEFPSE